MRDTLVVVPAREGSKGVPMKNIRVLHGKPLIAYTLELAKAFLPAENICVSTDGEQTRRVAEEFGVPVPFLRPPEISGDTAGTYEVLIHALEWYRSAGRQFSRVLLLQPTSPFRNRNHFETIFSLYDDSLEMVVSVGLSHHNPYFSLFEENADGFLAPSKTANFVRRQDCPPAYFYNGSMYLINAAALREKELRDFRRVRKMVMEDRFCLDIDTQFDWQLCEALLEKGLYKDEDI